MSNQRRYFIDNNIFYQGKRQPPRKVECFYYIVDDKTNMAHFSDKDGDDYSLPIEEIHILEEGEDL